jgi:predicted Zn-dependent peptidase
MGRIHQHQLDNGLWLLAEPVAAAQSLAMTMLLPAGSAAEPQDQQGVGSILSEMIFRGAGVLDARAHCDALDQFGVQRCTSIQSMHLSLHATMIGSRLPDALPLLMDMVRAAHLDAAALEPSRDLALQALDALEDEPQERVYVELRQRHFPPPLGRCHLGRRRDLESVTLEQVRHHFQQRFVPDGSVLGFAGQFDFDHLKDLVESHLGEWHGCADDPAPRESAPRGTLHCDADSTQVHIGVAYDALPETDEQSILQHAAQALLSGGMSARLFTEVREKRGLCYTVYASYIGYRDRGVMLNYAGTTVPRAQETLDVLIAELRKLSDGFEQDEFDRAVVGMKSRLVMQGESTGARARAIAMDQYLFERPRSLEELAAKVDAITPEQLRIFVKEHRPGTMTTVTIGPTPGAS